MNKTSARLKRAKRTREHIKKLSVPRLSVHRTLQHIYAQIISVDGQKTLVTASTTEKDFHAKNKKTNNVDMAGIIGEAIAKRALQLGMKQVAFDRSGYKYHGRVKALAEGARKGGLEF